LVAASLSGWLATEKEEYSLYYLRILDWEFEKYTPIFLIN
jgi:hypothetical protein